jgi:hypothetical protein
MFCFYRTTFARKIWNSISAANCNQQLLTLVRNKSLVLLSQIQRSSVRIPLVQVAFTKFASSLTAENVLRVPMVIWVMLGYKVLWMVGAWEIWIHAPRRIHSRVSYVH